MNADITMPDNSINATFKLEIVPDISDLATKAEVAAVEAQIPDVSGFATKTELSAVEAEIPTVPTNVSSFTNDSNYVTDSILQQNLLLSNALITGNVSSNAVVYSDIMSRLHSTFDSTKFTVTGSPTITDNGIASGFSASNYLNTGYLLNTSEPWTICTGKINFTNVSALQTIFCSSYKNDSATDNTPILLMLTADSKLRFTAATSNNYGNNAPDIAYNITGTHFFSANTDYYFKLSFTGSQYIVSFSTDGKNYTLDISVTNSNAAGSGYVLIGIRHYVTLVSHELSGSVDLKQFSIEVNGVTVFTGNKTGSDSYTVDGNTVTIPYTVTSGGAKIADAACRTAIQSVYAENGFAPYYTIDEANQNFTLPMGDLYGMLQKLSDRITALET